MSYTVKEALRSMRSNFRSTASAIGTIAVCFLILGTTTLLYRILDTALETEAQNTQYEAYIDDTLNEASAFALQGEILSLDNIASATFVSRDTAKADFAAFLQSDILNELPSDIFRHRFVICLKDLSLATPTQWRLEMIPGIAEVSGDAEVADGYENMRLGLRVIAFALIALLCMISFVVINNALAASFTKRKQQTYIMRLCGVSEPFIRKPFVLEGFLIGVCAALLALMLLWAFYTILHHALASFGIAQALGMRNFLSVGMEAGAIFMAGGICLGLFAGRFSGSGSAKKRHAPRI